MSENLNGSESGKRYGIEEKITNQGLRDKLEKLKRATLNGKNQPSQNKSQNEGITGQVVDRQQKLKEEEKQPSTESTISLRIKQIFIYIKKFFVSIIKPEDSSRDMYSLQKNLNEQIKNSSKN